MPEHYRALIVILVLATIVFAFAKGPVTAIAMTTEDFVRRRNAWYFVTLAGFLSPHFWIFIFITGVFLFFAIKKERNLIALFFFLILALPPTGVELPGFGGIRYFFEFNFLRLLSLLILLPACRIGRLKARTQEYSKILLTTDAVLSIYIALNIALIAPNDSFTGLIRDIIYWTVDVVIPYYAISRYLKDFKYFREVLASFVLAAMISSSVAVVEFLRQWLLYSGLSEFWSPSPLSTYILRGENLRANASSGNAIVLGYVVAVAIGFYLSFNNLHLHRLGRFSGFVLLIAGAIAPLSKGPWVGLLVIILLYSALSQKRLANAIKFVALTPPVVFLLLSTDTGTRLVDYLPFFGSLDEGSVNYRTQLLESSLTIIYNNPLFGTSDYLVHLEHMRQGQGIIDLVNTYLVIALNTGLIGLGLFIAFFILILIGILGAMRKLHPKSDQYCLGQSLFSVLTGILVIIFTVSPISHIPLLLWSVSALGVAFFSNQIDLNSGHPNIVSNIESRTFSEKPGHELPRTSPYSNSNSNGQRVPRE